MSTTIKNHKLIFSFTLLFIFTLCTAMLFGTVTAQAATKTITDPDGYSETIELPGKPTSLKVSKLTQTSATIKWTAPSNRNVDGYSVYRYNSSTKKYTLVKNTTSNSYKLSDLKTGTKYSYAVKAYIEVYGKKYYGSYSKVLYFYTSPKSTSLTKASYSSKGKIALKWKKVSDAKGYIIQYSTSKNFSNSGRTCTVFVSDNSTTSKTIGGLAKKTYYVRICSYKTTQGTRYCSKWSSVKTVKVKEGLSLKSMINYTKTTLDGRSQIKALTNNGVDIKKYSTTYDRFKAIYNWHAKHYKDFANCLDCNTNFNNCIAALYSGKKDYDVFILLAADNFQNNDGSVVMHKWSVIYISGVPYIFDPRLQGYTGNYTGTTYFGVTSSSTVGKKYLFDYWYYVWGAPERSTIKQYSA
ncbi:MAG: fibronectin type III domain-containing protein [Clostridiales bacterium]|nr:fibronectin type III domain-containing protein [Clostridiales bacterium]